MKHIGLVIPHTDITLELDLHRYLPKNCIVHTQRIWLDAVDELSEKKMVDIDLPNGIRYLVDIVNFDVGVFGCTSASVVNGIDGSSYIEEIFHESLKCPSVTAFHAVVEEIISRNASNVMLVTPYIDDVNEMMINRLIESGINVVSSKGLGLIEDKEISEFEPNLIVKWLYEQKDTIKEGTDLIFISCTNFRAMEIREELETLLGINIITTNYAICNWILKTLSFNI